MAELAKEVLLVNLEDEMRQSYLDYAMSVIVGRALPDVRDGLKPVHRRVLFAMSVLGNDWNKPYKSCQMSICLLHTQRCNRKVHRSRFAILLLVQETPP